jgi:hypothetical protein
VSITKDWPDLVEQAQRCVGPGDGACPATIHSTLEAAHAWIEECAPLPLPASGR